MTFSGKILWKLLLSLAMAGWAALNIFPTDDTPFADYIMTEVRAEEEAFGKLYAEAKARVEDKRAASLYVAFRQLGKEPDVDLQPFFPHINVIDVKNPVRRNEILVNEVLKRSKGKVNRGLDLIGGVAVTFRIADPNFAEQPSYQKAENLAKVMNILRQRLDGSGVAEPVIRQAGDDRVEVQLPGLSTKDNPEILEMIAKPARLEFRLVNREMPQVPPGLPVDQIPAGFQPLTMEIENSRTGEVTEVTYLVKRLPEATGDIIAEAFPTQNNSGQFEVSMNFTSPGSRTFQNLTYRMVEENRATNTIGQLAIVLDGKLYSAPTVQVEISGQGVIQGRFTQREAVELANVLNNPLDVPLEVAEKYEIGPALAADARDASIRASIYGVGAVILFMVAYYWVGGVIAAIAGVVNIVLVLGVMASIEATLSLPGVAALVLTLGMGVDGNILILERYREEITAGKGVRAALEGAFDKVFSTIVDANLTTLLTAGILIVMGTGPVKGFGTILAIGIVASMFCALIVTRGLMELAVAAGAKQMLGVKGIHVEGVDFMKFRRPAFLISWSLVLAGLVSVAVGGKDLFGIDFTGGDEVTMTYAERPGSEAITQLAREAGAGEVSVLFTTDLGSGEEMIKVQTPFGQGQIAADALIAGLPEAGFETVGISQIGGSVSSDIQWNALLSVLAAMAGILLYVAIRFEVGYGIGALVALVHDIFMTVGIFELTGGWLCSGQFSAPMLAAILMILGYSINDTIVIFDRIREELTLNPEMKLFQVINLAINRVLSRSLLTSLTTFVAALALYIFGAGVINDFAFVFMVGIVTGTFSSIYIASPIFYWWHKGDRRHVEEREIVPKKDWEISTREARG